MSLIKAHERDLYTPVESPSPSGILKNIVVPRLLRNKPSETFSTLRTAGFQERPLSSQPHKEGISLIDRVTSKVLSIVGLLEEKFEVNLNFEFGFEG
jgi:hypothetical protein